ncbi:hypothetical protein KAW64_17480 [bacterium]|nr:hypothetical protein [bacterium]
MSKIIFVVALAVVILGAGHAQAEPIDVFADEPGLGDGFIRLGCWNLRGINLYGSEVRGFLPGASDEDDLTILIETFAKAIGDLGLDIVAISEHQPRTDEPNRLHQIRDVLNVMGEGTWQAHESEIGYGESGSSIGGLQLAVLWNTDKVTIDPDETVLLSALRQRMRDSETGELKAASLRAPWLVPIESGALSFDLVIVHLKSNGDPPQQDEVDALEQFVREHQAAGDRHLVLCGDWNIRPDNKKGRERLRQLEVPVEDGQLMRILTVDRAPLSLDEWESLDDRELAKFGDPVANLVPFSHYNARSLDTFLDHIAISRGLNEIFDDPIEVTLADGGTDVRPGILVGRPTLAESQFDDLTDHLPIVMTLRTTSEAPVSPLATLGLRIVAAIPNPVGIDSQGEEVWLHNDGSTAQPLDGWWIKDDDGGAWELTVDDGIVNPGETKHVIRHGRPMHLTNSGDTILLVEPSGVQVDSKSYDSVSSGDVVYFD